MKACPRHADFLDRALPGCAYCADPKLAQTMRHEPIGFTLKRQQAAQAKHVHIWMDGHSHLGYAGMLIRCGSRFLLLKRNAYCNMAGTWAFPGGAIEKGETPRKAAQRECQEEIGQWLEPHADLGINNSFRLFLAGVPSCFEPTLNDEHDDFLWATMDQLPDPMHPNALLQLQQFFLKGIP